MLPTLELVAARRAEVDEYVRQNRLERLARLAAGCSREATSGLLMRVRRALRPAAAPCGAC